MNATSISWQCFGMSSSLIPHTPHEAQSDRGDAPLEGARETGTCCCLLQKLSTEVKCLQGGPMHFPKLRNLTDAIFDCDISRCTEIDSVHRTQLHPTQPFHRLNEILSEVEDLDGWKLDVLNLFQNRFVVQGTLLI